jgi:hypothetical protein
MSSLGKKALAKVGYAEVYTPALHLPVPAVPLLPDQHDHRRLWPEAGGGDERQGAGR